MGKIVRNVQSRYTYYYLSPLSVYRQFQCRSRPTIGQTIGVGLSTLEFRNKEIGVAGEVDLFLENGEYALLVEVKTNTSIDDVRDHIERLKKYRRVADIRGDHRRFIAAIGGGVVREEVREFAVQRGLYVIQQSGENVEVVPPVGKPQEW